jgi:hypothetical protein
MSFNSDVILSEWIHDATATGRTEYPIPEGANANVEIYVPLGRALEGLNREHGVQGRSLRQVQPRQTYAIQ